MMLPAGCESYLCGSAHTLRQTCQGWMSGTQWYAWQHALSRADLSWVPSEVSCKLEFKVKLKIELHGRRYSQLESESTASCRTAAVNHQSPALTESITFP